LKPTYIHGPGIDEPLMMDREGTNYFYHTDGLGSVVGLSNDLGEMEQQYLYTSFGGMTVFNKEGSEIQSTDGIKNAYGYTGREMDSESSLYYYRTRYYSHARGQFPLRYATLF
jgi:RHS repeat-associated protein